MVHSSSAGEGSDVNPCYDGDDPDPSQCDSNESDEKNCNKASPFQLKQAEIYNPHSYKNDFGAIPNSRFDICACKDGRIIIKAQGHCGKPGPSIRTGDHWK